MATVQFFPLEIAHKVAKERSQVLLFGRTAANEQICVVDEGFEPYFYVLAKNPEQVMEKLLKIRVEKDDSVHYVTKTEIAAKKYLEKDVPAVKVYTHLPADIPIITEIIKQWEIIDSIHEHDIKFTRRYLIDKKIVPTTLVEVEGTEFPFKSRFPAIKAEKITSLGEESLKELKVLAFDIEVYNPEGTETSLEKSPVIMLSFYGDDFKKSFTWKGFKTDSPDIEFVKSESELIDKFKDTIVAYKPDILAGYSSDKLGLPYIISRAEKYKIKLDIGIDFSEVYIEQGSAKIAGIAYLDVLKCLIKTIGSSLNTESYSLKDVALELLGEETKEADPEELSYVWDNKPEDLARLCSYNLDKSISIYKLCKKVLPILLEITKVVGLPVHTTSRKPMSELVEAYLLRQAFLFNEIAPNKPDGKEIGNRKRLTYRGAFVFEPKPGLYQNIAVFDYRSLYPSIISSYNISPGTLNCDCCREKQETAPIEDDTRYWFCKRVKGFIPAIIEELITRRMRIKEIMKKKEDVFLSARDNALKLLANSFYGYFAFFGARWYCIECARSVTAWGRFYIKDVIEKAQKNGFNVIYSDTDSVFLSLEKKTKQDAEKFLEMINLKLEGLMELEFEGFYSSGIFVSSKDGTVGAKKKYALISELGFLKIRGFEAVRRNWSTIAKESQEAVIDIILRQGNASKALQYVRKVITDLKENKIAPAKLVLKTQLQKEIADYDSIGPHVAVAQKLINKGIDVETGSVISYVITKTGGDKIRDRADIPENVKQDEYDVDYYINNQIIPAVEKIFEVVGYNKEQILATKDQKKLEGFF